MKERERGREEKRNIGDQITDLRRQMGRQGAENPHRDLSKEREREGKREKEQEQRSE